VHLSLLIHRFSACLFLIQLPDVEESLYSPEAPAKLHREQLCDLAFKNNLSPSPPNISLLNSAQEPLKSAEFVSSSLEQEALLIS